MVATGRHRAGARLPVGQIIDRADDLLFGYGETLESEPEFDTLAGDIVVCEATQALLDRRFELRKAPKASYSVVDRRESGPG